MFRRVALAAISAFFVAAAWPTTVSARPMRVTIVATNHDVHRAIREYRIAILAPGDPIDIDVPYRAVEADLIVAGRVVRRVGEDVPLGVAPLGHASTLLSLAGLGVGEKIVLRIVGSRAEPTLVTELRPVSVAHVDGAIGGAYLATLVVVALFSLVTLVASRDVATSWYLAFVASTVAIELVRDGFVLSDSSRAPAALLATILLAASTFGAFAATYLKLWSESRALLGVAAVVVLVPIGSAVAFEIATRAPVDNITIVVPILAGSLTLCGISIRRRIEGFGPATFLLIGMLGLSTFFAAKIFRVLTGGEAPFIERFGFEFGMAFDVLVLSVGLAYRSRYNSREYAKIARELDGATYDAHHDHLTGLLNRRGLDALMERLGGRGTVLFIDIDGFKSVNDRFGHAVGDATLVEIGRILARVVRNGDFVARVGGDEFVVVHPQLSDHTIASDIVERARNAISSMRPIEHDEIRIGASIGSSPYGGTTDFSDALEAADDAAYEMKARRIA